MSTNNECTYPVTKKTLHRYADSIFRPITRGECVTTVWVPMAGRRMWNKFIIENIRLFGNELPHFDRYLLVYIEPLDLTEESLAGYIRLMAKTFIDVAKRNPEAKVKVKKGDIDVFDNPDTTYSRLLEKLKELLRDVTESGLNIIFFVGEFDELTFANKIFYNNLKSLWSGLFPRLHYIFLMRERVTKRENVSTWGELNEAILQNVVYVPLGDDTDIRYWINNFSSGFSLEISESQYQVIKKLCGGHPYLLKVAVRVLNNQDDKKVSDGELEDTLLNYYELRSVAKGILNVQGDKEKECLKFIVKKGTVDRHLYKDVLTFLEKMGYIYSQSEGGYKVFSEVFEQVLLYEFGMDDRNPVVEEDGGSLRLDENTGAIILDGKTIEEKFTRQEYIVLTEFIKDTGKLLTRDDIGSVLWGKESYERYSDWAIDQLISKLRKKLKGLSSKSRLVTIRGKGYKYTNLAI